MLGPNFAVIPSPSEIMFLIVLGGSFALAAALGVFQPRRIVGPQRLRDNRMILPVGIAGMMAFCVMIVVASMYVAWRHKGLKAPVRESASETNNIVDSAFLYSVPPLASFAMLLIADYVMGRIDLIRQLGLRFSNIPRGIGKGCVAAMIVLPPTYLVSLLTELAYQRIHFQHPQEHQLLQVLGEAPAHHFAQAVLIASATIIAPLSEEFLFRGHLQTLIRQWLVIMSSRRRQPMAGPFPGEPAIAPVNSANPIPPVTQAAPPIASKAPVWQGWVAVLATSCLFAAMHPSWMWPPIFFLALGLGYWYERTGNLWTNVTVHCFFNSISTFLFLTSAHP